MTDSTRDAIEPAVSRSSGATGRDAAASEDTAAAVPDADDPERLLTVRGLRTEFSTGDGVVRAVDGVDFHIDTGEIVGLVGESGAGKSATARSVLRLIQSPGEIVGGEVRFDGEDVLSMEPEELREFRGSRTGMVFQDPSSTLNPTMEVGSQVAEAVTEYRDVTQGTAREEAVALLDRVGIPNAAERYGDYPHEFSGGQKQRIVVAIAIACRPDLLVADEPTTALDVTIQAQILELLQELGEDMGMSVLFITHDLGVVRELCDRVAIMYAGSIVESGDVEALFTDPRHPYTKGLLQSIPGVDTLAEAAGGRDRLRSIEGSMPDLSEPFEGCKYADRCPAATDACREDHPPLEPVGDGDRSVACIHHDRTAELDYRTETDAASLSWTSNVSNGDGRGETLVEVESLTKHFETGGLLDSLFGSSEPVRAVDGIDLRVNAGETVGLVGESGCGKSTAARSMLRLLEPTDGRVVYRGTNLTALPDEEMRTLRRDLQIVFQDPKSSLNPRRTVRRIIERPMELHGLAEGEERAARVRELIRAVGLEERYLDRYPGELSGGQQQRIGIARALAVNPEVIVLDEPVSGLDVSVQAQILNLLADIQAELDLGYLLISHDLSVVRHVCDRIAVMYLGEIVEHGGTETVFDPPYHPYTEALLSSVPGRGETGLEDRIVLEGDVPDPSNVPDGCRFHPRCPHKIGEVCEREAPEVHDSGDGAVSCHLMREEYADEATWDRNSGW
jgi:peptide/nickel transport system ATP-binding protein